MSARNYLLALMFAPACALAAPHYNITALPTGTNPYGINASGHIVGSIETADGARGFVWSAGNLVQMGTLGGPSSIARSINASGQVVGYSSLANGDSHAFSYSGAVMTDLYPMGAATSFGMSVNNSGQVAGSYYSDGPTGAFLMTGGVALDIGGLGGNFSAANAVNSAGHVVGFSSLPGDFPWLQHAFLYADGVMKDLGTMQGASLSEATAINDSGQIAGHGWVFGYFHAFMYENDEMRDLGTLGGLESYAYGLNSHGQVVGRSSYADSSDYSAYLYDGGVMTDLNSLVDPALGWVLHSAMGINDARQIVAYGCRGEECGSVLLELAAPIPEPGTWAMMLAGLGLLRWRSTPRRT